MSRYDFSDEARATDEELAGDLSRLGALSDDEVARLLPAPADQEQLKSLIAAVNRATDENQKKAVLANRLGTVTDAVKTVVTAIIKAAV